MSGFTQLAKVVNTSGVRKILGGVRIAAIVRNSESNLLVLDTDHGSLYLRAIGDCCSQSYFEDFSGIDALRDSPVRGVFDVDFPDRKEESEYGDATQHYALEIQTAKGPCRIAYRNESNGYYGGWCEAGRVIAQPDGAEYCEDEPSEKLDRSKLIAVTDN